MGASNSVDEGKAFFPRRRQRACEFHLLDDQLCSKACGRGALRSMDISSSMRWSLTSRTRRPWIGAAIVPHTPQKDPRKKYLVTRIKC